MTLDFADGDTKPCPLFVGRYFSGVKNGPSPDWLQRRLKAIGLRPISALVDITNYITFAYAPAACMSSTPTRSRAISTRASRATARTSLALDGKTYALDPDA